MTPARADELSTHDAGSKAVSPSTVTARAILEGPGARIGPYTLLEQLGEGGFGLVYVAEQDQPVRRKVALKILKPGMDSRAVVARFGQERQALALMDHPHIAKVLDGGATDSGRPYFVMELVKGIPITQYCDREHLTVQQRVELFIPVCHAVQHAHQKGILHRDLKPSNILVALYDGKPVPKIIDFGVAKAIHGSLTRDILYTVAGQIVGTYEYMAPEQAEGDNLDIDTRADIYSLGVILYELLTGSPPFSRKKLKGEALEAMLKLIREVEPPKPSTRLTDSEELETIAGLRHQEPSRLTRQVHGDLDWIVMKCLSKERSRRYDTADALATDIGHYLHNEPVTAGPPSVSYRARKFIRRHKATVLAASLVFLTLVGGVIGTGWGLVEARRQRDAAESAAEAEKVSRVTVEKINEFLILEVLWAAAPENNPRNERVTVEEALDRAATKIEGKFEDQPIVEAEIRWNIGDTYRALGKYAAAVGHMERALELFRQHRGEEHRDTLNAMSNLARLHRSLGEYSKAEPLWVEALGLCRRAYGEEDSLTLTLMNNLASMYLYQERYSESETLFLKVLEARRRLFGEGDASTLRVMNNLAILFQNQKRYAAAEPYLVKVLEVHRRTLGEEKPETLTSMNNLAMLYRDQGRYAEAEPLCVKVLEISRRVNGENHPDTVDYLNNLGSLYHRTGRLTEAEPYYVEALRIIRDESGVGVPTAQSVMNNLAVLYEELGRPQDGEPLLREAAVVVERRDGADSSTATRAWASLGWNLTQQQKYAEAEPLLLARYEWLERHSAGATPDREVFLREAVDRLVRLYEAWGNPERASEWRKKHPVDGEGK